MSFGPMEIILLLAIVLIFFGPSRLPNLGRAIGETIKGFKAGISEAKDEKSERDVTNTAKKEIPEEKKV